MANFAVAEVSLGFEEAVFALSDSIMPLMRLKLEAIPPGLRVEVQYSKRCAVIRRWMEVKWI